MIIHYYDEAFCCPFSELLGSLAAAAFAPANSKVSSKSKLAATSFSKEIGAQAPRGFWDPLGVLEGKLKEQFDRLRGQEIKHGSVAMLAVVGYLVTYVSSHGPCFSLSTNVICLSLLNVGNKAFSLT